MRNFADELTAGPLQAPQEIVDKYKGLYDDGPEALRLRRLSKLKELGLVEEDVCNFAAVANGKVTPHPMIGAYGTQDWDKLSAEERASSARKMEVCVALIKLTEGLRSHGRVDGYAHWSSRVLSGVDWRSGQHVCLLFERQWGRGIPVRTVCDQADRRLEAIPIMGDMLQNTIKRFFNNSLENIGRGDSVGCTETDLMPVYVPWTAMGSSGYGTFKDVQR